jgi:hypothetical protein
MTGPEPMKAQRQLRVMRLLSARDGSVGSIELAERMFIAQEQLRKRLWRSKELSHWAQQSEVYARIRATTREFLAEEGSTPSGADVFSESAELLEVVGEAMSEFPEVPDGVRSLAEDYYQDPPMALLIACVGTPEVWSNAGDEALSFLEDHGLPESMTRWVAELLILHPIGEELGKKLRLPRRVSRTIILSGPDESPPVFKPPLMASPEQLDTAIANFYKDAEAQTRAKYLALAPRALESQAETLRRNVDWLFLAQVCRVNAREIASNDRVNSERSTKTNDVNRGIKTVLAYLDGKSL